MTLHASQQYTITVNMLPNCVLPGFGPGQWPSYRRQPSTATNKYCIKSLKNSKHNQI